MRQTGALGVKPVLRETNVPTCGSSYKFLRLLKKWRDPDDGHGGLKTLFSYDLFGWLPALHQTVRSRTLKMLPFLKAM